MSPKPRLIINLTAVFVLAVVTVSWAVLRLAGPGGFEGPYRVVVDFESSGGVFTDQQVTYRGVLVGKVGEMSLNDDGVNIELLISPEWKDRIPSDVEARIGSKSAVGEQFVNLTPRSGAGGDETLSEGDVIPRTATSLPVDFQELLGSLDRVLADVPPQRTRRLAENLAAGLGGREEDIASILRSLGTLADTFASVADEQQRLLDSSTEAGREFLRTKDNFAAAVRAADRVFEGIGERPEELRRLFAQSDRFARNTSALLARHRGNLSGGIRALADFVSFQLSERDAVVQSLKHLPQFLKAIEEASIPWRSLDGRRFYRLRVGLVVDDVPASWPCKYQTRDVGGRRYERHYFERSPKRLDTRGRCVPRSATGAQAEREMESLLTALQQWAEENPEHLVQAIQQESDGATGEGSGPIESFVWPLSGPITSYFGPRGERMHTGIDIAGELGAPVVAGGTGRVIMSERYSGYGKTVVVDHGGGLSTLYGHLSELGVGKGELVEAGDVIGAVGCTGSCTGNHLHFEVRVNGTPVDPLPYLPGGMLYLAS